MDRIPDHWPCPGAAFAGGLEDRSLSGFPAHCHVGAAFPALFIVTDAGDQLIGVTTDRAVMQALELASGIESEVQYFTIG